MARNGPGTAENEEETAKYAKNAKNGEKSAENEEGLPEIRSPRSEVRKGPFA